MNQFLKSQEGILNENIKILEKEYLESVNRFSMINQIKFNIKKSINSCKIKLQNCSSDNTTKTDKINLDKCIFSEDIKEFQNLLNQLEKLLNYDDKLELNILENKYAKTKSKKLSYLSSKSKEVCKYYNSVFVRVLDDLLLDLYLITRQLYSAISLNCKASIDLDFDSSDSSFLDIDKLRFNLREDLKELESLNTETLWLNLIFTTKSLKYQEKPMYEVSKIDERTSQPFEEIQALHQEINILQKRLKQYEKSQEQTTNNIVEIHQQHQVQLDDFLSQMNGQIFHRLDIVIDSFSRLNSSSNNFNLERFIGQCGLHLPELEKIIQQIVSGT